MATDLNAMSLIGIFFLGLGLNLTPCVYPMLSVTISLFSRNRESGSHQAAFPKAVFYVLGIALTNTLLGLFASLTGGILGQLLQHSVVLFLLSGFLFVLALSMFGIFHLQAPSWILSRLSGPRNFSFAGFFASGALVGIFAAPCMGPPLLALFAWVATFESVTKSILVFFVMSLGLGLPYLLLGSFSGLLDNIPRSGAWLIWFERLFGVILCGFAMYYLSIAAFPMARPLVLPLVLAGGGLYLGFLEASAKYAAGFNFFRKTVGFLAIAVAVMIPFSGPRDSLLWQPYQESNFQASLASGRPVVLDFYADWCFPCQEMEHYTYTDKRVIQALQSFDRYKVDMTHGADESTEKLIDRYGIDGVPTMIFSDEHGNEIESMRVSGFFPPEEFLKILERHPARREIKQGVKRS